MEHENDSLKYNFKYTDQFGNMSHLKNKVGYSDDSSEYDLLVNEFRNFLIVCGFLEETVNKRIKPEHDED